MGGCKERGVVRRLEAIALRAIDRGCCGKCWGGNWDALLCSYYERHRSRLVKRLSQHTVMPSRSNSMGGFRP